MIRSLALFAAHGVSLSRCLEILATVITFFVMFCSTGHRIELQLGNLGVCSSSISLEERFGEYFVKERRYVCKGTNSLNQRS